jgi:hypothetical protein
MQHPSLQKTDIMQNSHIRVSIQLITFVTLLVISNYVFATDLLKGTDADLKDIMGGTGKNWLLWIDGAISLGMFAYTKKPMVFFSVLGVLLFITVLVKMTGTAAL